MSRFIDSPIYIRFFKDIHLTDEQRLFKLWEDSGLLEGLSKEDSFKCSRLYTQAILFMEKRFPNDIKYHDYIIPVVRRIFSHLKYLKYEKYYEFNVSSVLKTFIDNVDDIIEFNKGKLKYSDYEAVSIGNLAEDIAYKIVYINKLKITDPEKYKIIIREEKLNKIL